MKFLTIHIHSANINKYGVRLCTAVRKYAIRLRSTIYRISGMPRFFFALFTVLCIFRLSYLGYRYTMYLDDFVQYLLYPTFAQPWKNILLGGAGILYTRPLAGLADFFLWSSFGRSPGLAVLIITALHALSAVLFFGYFRRSGFAVTSVFLCFYAFIPINTEGTYWLSASTRIVVSLFFTALSCFFASYGKTALFALFNAVSMCFYEQTALLSFFMAALDCIMRKKPLRLAVPFFNAALIAAYYIFLGGKSNNSARLALTSLPELAQHAKKISMGLLRMFGSAQLTLTLRGAYRGIADIFKSHAYLYLFFMLLLIWLFYISCRNFDFKMCSTGTKNDSRAAEHCKSDSKPNPETANFRSSTVKKFVFGTVLALIPLLPLYAASEVRLSFRNAAASLVGTALMADAVIPALFKSRTPAVLGICTLVFFSAAVSEVSDYDITARRDLALAEKIAASVPPDNGEPTEIFYTCNAPYHFEQNCLFGDHIISARGSSWGITGAVRTLSGNKRVIVTESRSEKQ